MPVYGYKCSSCGFEEDIIQLSAPGFELKGKGWAATDCNAGHTGVAAAHTKNK